jgi:hypothetical protein
MPFSDELKNFRSKGYAEKGSGKDKEEGMDSGEKNETPRIIALTDEEKDLFKDSHPGEDLSCEVHGTLESDGRFRVMTVSPMNGSYGDEKSMAGQVAQKVMPSAMPMISPS